MASDLTLLQYLASLAKYNIQAELSSVIKRFEGFKSSIRDLLGNCSGDRRKRENDQEEH